MYANSKYSDVNSKTYRKKMRDILKRVEYQRYKNAVYIKKP
jgi:hypothetical protein